MSSRMNSEHQYLDKTQLAEKLGLPSKRAVEELMRKRKIPYLTLGYRTVRFFWPAVEKALAKLEIKAVGQA